MKNMAIQKFMMYFKNTNSVFLSVATMSKLPSTTTNIKSVTCKTISLRLVAKPGLTFTER